MKTIQTVITLIQTAQDRARRNEEGHGIAKRNKRQRYYNWGGGTTVGELQEVYRVEFKRGLVARLYHYETLTAELYFTDDTLYVYGESRSDADSVNTFLDYFGIAKRYTYRPVNGGFMEIE